MDQCTAAEVITALTPIITAIMAAIPAYGLGLTRPSAREKALQAKVDSGALTDKADLATRRSNDAAELSDRRTEDQGSPDGAEGEAE